MVLSSKILGHAACQLHNTRDLLAMAPACKHFGGTVRSATQTFINTCTTEEERDNIPLVKILVVRTKEWECHSPFSSKEWVGRDWGIISKYQQVLKHQEILWFDQIFGYAEHRHRENPKCTALFPIIPTIESDLE